MTKIPYFPGCTLSTKAKNLDQQARKIAGSFGFDFVEVPDWVCCGAVYPNSIKNLMRFVGPYRILANSATIGKQVVTLCSACFNVLRRVNKLIQENQEVKQKLQVFTELDYNGEVEVLHYLEFLRDRVTYDRIKEKAKQQKKPKALKVAPYYGCLLLRPQEELQFDDSENPTFIANIINAVGDDAIQFPLCNECCGAHLSVYEQDSLRPARCIGEEARTFGAEVLVTSCPLCYYNVDKTQLIPVKYFTEYLASALGIK